MTRISVVIPNLNGAKLLAGSIGAVRDSLKVETEVIVVDNGSTDESLELLADEFPDAVMVSNAENQGFARGCNQGVRRATNEFVLLLNTDAVVDLSCLSELVAVAAVDEKSAAWQPRLLPATSGQVEPLFSLFTRSGFLWHVSPDEADRYGQPTRVFSLKGACMLVRKSAFDALGGFDERFFAYLEETDLCWRLQLADWNVMYVPSAIVHHVGGATSTKIFSSAQLDFLSFRNRIRSLIKNLGRREMLRVLPVHIALCFAIMALYLVRGRWTNARAVGQAMTSVMGERKLLLSQRRSIQSSRLRSDVDLFRGVTTKMSFTRARQFSSSYIKSRAEIDRPNGEIA